MFFFFFSLFSAHLFVLGFLWESVSFVFLLVGNFSLGFLAILYLFFFLSVILFVLGFLVPFFFLLGFVVGLSSLLKFTRDQPSFILNYFTLLFVFF